MLVEQKHWRTCRVVRNISFHLLHKSKCISRCAMLTRAHTYAHIFTEITLGYDPCRHINSPTVASSHTSGMSGRHLSTFLQLSNIVWLLVSRPSGDDRRATGKRARGAGSDVNGSKRHQGRCVLWLSQPPARG